MEGAHSPSEEEEERHHELEEVVAEGLEAVDPPWGLVQEVGHRVGHWLCLGDRRRPVSQAWSSTPQGTSAHPHHAARPCPLCAHWLSQESVLAGKGSGETSPMDLPPAAQMPVAKISDLEPSVSALGCESWAPSPCLVSFNSDAGPGGHPECPGDPEAKG